VQQDASSSRIVSRLTTLFPSTMLEEHAENNSDSQKIWVHSTLVEQ
jgi:hypothetical protein